MTILVLGTQKHSALMAQLAALHILAEGNAELSEKLGEINKAVSEGEIALNDDYSAHLVTFSDKTWESNINTVNPIKDFHGRKVDEITATYETVSRAALFYQQEQLDALKATQLEVGALYWLRAGGRVSYWIIDSIKGNKVFVWYSNKQGEKLRDAAVEFPDVRSLQKAKNQPSMAFVV